ncbi:hypothetical protein FNV43_RR11362 [Rhamnella rubrinervis]|uniref:Uncharacterized protein n=1 Tax=Rhamnella rubrinervis TaxID=2594499 RepID=A0A8K0MHT0_9ROSA|nr:hypothetical protein FNV43_RR11362 [Rhamnella rubrinervis]
MLAITCILIGSSLFINFSGKVVAKFCAKYLHQQVLKNEAYAAGDVGTSVQKAFFRLCLVVLNYT